MDKDQLGMALEGLGIYSRELSPAYQAVRERLAGSMAINGMMLEELRFQKESISPNSALVNDFIDLLPVSSQASYHTRANFSVDETYTARMLEGNVAWLPDQFFDNSGSVRLVRTSDGKPEARKIELQPFYIIGERPSTKHANATALLLSSAAKSGYASRIRYTDKIVAASVWTDEKESIEKLISERLAAPYSEEEMVAMFNGYRNLDIYADNVVGFVHRPFVRPLRRQIPRSVRRHRGINMSMAVDLKGGLTNDALAQFGVLDRLNRLALAFNKVDELEALMSAQKEKAPENPMTKYFETESET